MYCKHHARKWLTLEREPLLKPIYVPISQRITWFNFCVQKCQDIFYTIMWAVITAFSCESNINKNNENVPHIQFNNII